MPAGIRLRHLLLFFRGWFNGLKLKTGIGIALDIHVSSVYNYTCVWGLQGELQHIRHYSSISRHKTGVPQNMRGKDTDGWF